MSIQYYHHSYIYPLLPLIYHTLPTLLSPIPTPLSIFIPLLFTSVISSTCSYSANTHCMLKLTLLLPLLSVPTPKLLLNILYSLHYSPSIFFFISTIIHNQICSILYSFPFIYRRKIKMKAPVFLPGYWLLWRL